MRAAVYLRISEDRTGEQLGVVRQRQDCEQLCRSKGWTPVEYVDNDMSATNGKPRPAYEKMLADICDGTIGAVVAWDLDRLHRRPIELESFMALADEKHLALATVSGDVDLSTAQGRLVARLKGSVAAHEGEHRKARQLRAARQRADQGVPNWSRAFGYLDDTRQLELGIQMGTPEKIKLCRIHSGAIDARPQQPELFRAGEVAAFGVVYGLPLTRSVYRARYDARAIGRNLLSEVAAGRPVHIRAWLVAALLVAGSGEEAMDSADGLIEAAEATGNPLLLRVGARCLRFGFP